MITLERFAYTPMGTFGKLTYNDFSCFTVERPWMDNQPHVSCIPEGNYTLEWYDGPKFGRVFAFSGGTVSVYPSANTKRSAVLIHPANVMSDLEGCVGLGDSLGYVKNQWAVLNSGVTIKTFYKMFSNSDNHFNITIKHFSGAV